MNELEKENEMNTKKEKQPTFNNRGYIITIKILIWLGCFVSYVIVNTLFAALTGFMFGYGITIFFLLFGAKKLCDKWEENYIKKQNGVARRKKVVWQTTPTILNSDIVDEQGEEKQNDDLNEIGVSGKSNRKKSNNFSFLNIIYLILSGISMLSIVVALNIQDIKRNELEHWNTTIVYLTILFIFVLFVSFSIYSLVKKKYKLVSAVSPILLLVLLVSYIEGSVFSRYYIKTNSYSFLQWYDNYEDVAVCNTIWIFSVILICVIAFIPIISLFISRCKEKYFRSVKYREKCYDRVAKLHNHLEKGIISESEYEKTKKDILKSIK